MTEEYHAREGRKLSEEELFPQGARQKMIVARIQKFLMDRGVLESTAYTWAVKIWRLTRRT